MKTIYPILPGIFLAVVAWTCLACNPTKSETSATPTAHSNPKVEASFTLLPPEETGVLFSNNFKEDFNYNIFTYEYLYNGCGVAVGDVNGDGLPDLYFSASFGPNRLFINLGDMKFKDVSEAAGVSAPRGYKTGVAMADINGDGKLDIYSCRTSKDDDGQKTNHVFINMGNQTLQGLQVPVFEDQAQKLGLADNHNSNHVCLFDFDRDGDLDLFLMNHRIDFAQSARLRLREDESGAISRITSPASPFESNLLYRNDNGRFTDITKEAGLESSAFGLSVTAADLNGDGWMDLYVANDYIEPDYIYINNRDGTFTDMYQEYLRHSSQNSMGADIADINNDGLVDIMVLDMKAEHPIRYKELMHVMQYDRYNLLIQYGYGRQQGKNVLQLNNGNQTFSEIGQFAGMAATDWSWAPLMADFNNDGWKDVYITNGYLKDVLNLDYTNYFRDSISKSGGVSPDKYPNIQEFLKYLPEYKATNYLYINNKNLTFADAGALAGMHQNSYSNGAAYADLDLDGDLDIIVNNIKDPAFIYRNDIQGKNWLQIATEYIPQNHYGLGTIARVYHGDQIQHNTLSINKGFFSTSEPVMHFGLDKATRIDSIILTWPLGSQEILRDVEVNQRIIWKKGTGSPYTPSAKPPTSGMFAGAGTLSQWIHEEDEFVDFKREKLIPYMLSAEGPCMVVGDINGDQLEDVYVGNGSGFPAKMWFQRQDGSFQEAMVPAFQQDAGYEDCGAVLDDFDNDGDLDLIVVSGGNAFPVNADEYLVRFYTNDGQGGMKRSLDFPIVRTNAGVVLAFDYDGDGDKDLFIGGRSTPGYFPKPPRSYLLRNEGGKFQDVTSEVFPHLENWGMITDIKSADLNGDGIAEMVIVGDWMPVSVFSFNGKKYTDVTATYGLQQSSGWWKTITLADVDGDGDIDILAGNIGLNHRLRTSPEQPITLISKDFDGNGSQDPIMCFYHDAKLYPFAGRDMIIGQLPMLKKNFIRYTPYANATIQDIFTKEQLKDSDYYYVRSFETTLFRNQSGKFTAEPLPYRAQLHPTYSILVHDFNQDGRVDMLLAGNFKYMETETGELDAGNGTLLIQQPDGTFRFEENRTHGFWAQKEVRKMAFIQMAGGRQAILTANNRGPVEIHMLQRSLGKELQ